jgi:S1-C subfamily serine protease
MRRMRARPHRSARAPDGPPEAGATQAPSTPRGFYAAPPAGSRTGGERGRGRGGLGPADARTAGGPPPAPTAPVRSSRRARLWAALAVVVILGLLAALIVTNLRISGRPSVSMQQVDRAVAQSVSSAISQLQEATPTGESVYQAVEAGLVVVEARRPASAGGDDLGSGVVVDTAGDILTALHVVKGATAVQVTFADGTVSPAVVAGTEAADDIAELVPSRLPAVMQPLVLGSGPQVGDEAFVVGNPLGLAGSLSAGVVSGLDRTFAPTTGPKLSGLIQFDAAVNPGSSGGPLLNTQCQVVGIVVGLANPSGNDAFAGIGFAVPIATAGGAAGAPPK